MTGPIHDDVLLTTATARRLYHYHAAHLPIIDYHSHLDAHDLLDDRRFASITALWITSDPYKHRAMRIAGVPERLITGDATDRERFDAWAATVPQTIGNPLYFWTALELKRFFVIDEPLSPATADAIWQRCNERLGEATHRARGLLARYDVACVCTSDRLTDDLAVHARLAAAGLRTRVLPSLRIDDVDAVDADTCDAHLERFRRAGCRLADHAAITGDRERWWRLANTYARHGWTLLLHLGAQRHTSSRLRERLGPAGGYAAIGDALNLQALCGFLDELDRAGHLPRTVLFPANPADYAPCANLSGSFARDGVRGLIQLGPAWWFNDHDLGMHAQLDACAGYGLLSTNIGMTTDARSLLSLARHEHFRRVLCDWLGRQVTAGRWPDDDGLNGRLVADLCHHNAHRCLFPDEATP